MLWRKIWLNFPTVTMMLSEDGHCASATVENRQSSYRFNEHHINFVQTGEPGARHLQTFNE